MDYEGYIPYPKYLYHATEPACVAPDKAAHEALGDGWYESPVDPAADPATTEPAKAKRGRPAKPVKVDEPAKADETADAGAAGGE
jgi:hypothetical protein